MRVLRLKIHQNKAHYKKYGSVENKETYSLPPFSTIIGAIHYACGYKEYHFMDISVQGTFDTMTKEIYTDNSLLSTYTTDRNILCKRINNKIFYKCNEIAEKATDGGNIDENGSNILLHDKNGLNEYLDYKKKKDINDKHNEDFLNDIIKDLKSKEDNKKKELKNFKKDEKEYKVLNNEIKELIKQRKEHENKKKKVNTELEELKKHYPILTKSIKSYEVLHNVDLIIHIRSDEKTLQDIYNNQYNLVALGRTEDTIELKEIKFVELTNDIEDEVIDNLKNNNMMYVSKEAFNKEELFFDLSKVEEEIDVQGTKYFINKDYKIVKNKRIFNTKEVILTSGFGLSYDDKEHMYIDEDKNIVEML